MPKNKTDEPELVEAVQPVAPIVPVVVMVRPPRDKVYGIEQWAQLRNKPVRHLAGIKAFLGLEAGNKHTLEMWDAKMASY